MKRLIISMSIICMTSISALAQRTETYEFYGTKAAANAENPCKGATTRTCGKKTIKYDEMKASDYGCVEYGEDDIVVVTEDTKDNEGNLLSRKTRVIPGSIQDAIQIIDMELTQMGALKSESFDATISGN